MIALAATAARCSDSVPTQHQFADTLAVGRDKIPLQRKLLASGAAATGHDGLKQGRQHLKPDQFDIKSYPWKGETIMPRTILSLTALLLTTVGVMLAGHGDGGAVAGTAPPDVAGTWQGTWSHRIGSGRITLQLTQEGTTVTGSQSVRGVIPFFGQGRRRQIVLSEQIREGLIEDSTLTFNVLVRDGPEDQVNFTLSVSGDNMDGTVCGFTCGTVRLKKRSTS